MRGDTMRGDTMMVSVIATRDQWLVAQALAQQEVSRPCVAAAMHMDEQSTNEDLQSELERCLASVFDFS